VDELADIFFVSDLVFASAPGFQLLTWPHSGPVTTYPDSIGRLCRFLYSDTFAHFQLASCIKNSIESDLVIAEQQNDG
jgi:hypothetical protein